MDFNKSYDEKILGFNVSKDWDDFIEIFKEEEIEAMRKALEYYTGYDYSIAHKEDVILDYIKDWLIYLIKEDCLNIDVERLFMILKRYQ